MYSASKYTKYTVEDFVEDKDFRCWVNSPTEILDYFWTKFKQEHSEKIVEINQARKIVEIIYFEENPIPEEQIQNSLDHLMKTLTDQTDKKRRFVRYSTYWTKAAAILVIPLILAGIYFAYQNDTQPAAQIKCIVPEGHKSNLILADGTSVWINSGSMLVVPIEFSSKVRKVFLNGEAYFDAIKDKKTPFLVETKSYTVKVYGTKFNVRAYDFQQYSETVLKEGFISILTNTNKEINILPGQRFLVDANKQYSISEVNPENYMGWKENVFKINNEKLEDLILKMEHWYGVEINVENLDRVRNLRYTLTIKTEGLKEMLALMNLATPLTYKIDGNKINIKYKLN